MNKSKILSQWINKYDFVKEVQDQIDIDLPQIEESTIIFENTTKGIKLTIKLNNKELAEVNDINSLGLDVQNNLKWTHISKLTKKIQ